MLVNKGINSFPKRSSGILLPVNSLPGPHGIGDLGSTAFSFIDFLSRAGQKYWQILPVGPTSPAFGNSPYMSFSAFGGDPLLISPELLIKENLLHQSELPGNDLSEYIIDYDKIRPLKNRLLHLAWKRFSTRGDDQKLAHFKKDNPWVNDHALFLALKNRHEQRPWYKWPTDIRRREDSALRQATYNMSKDIDYSIFVQFLFFRQWDRLHSYAQHQNIHIIGDLPIYVALDSVDVWANQDIFDLNRKNGLPNAVAGVPPDYFSATGQLWGSPLYRWNSRSHAVKDRLYAWWQHRLTSIYKMVDMIRIDHFRGFESYWSVPAREKTAIHGSWKKGPGLRFFREMERRLGPMSIIAENLGVITPAVEKLRDALGYPGMKILLFAFDGTPGNSYLPQNFTNNCVVYTGTHDNDTAIGWYLRSDTRPEIRRQAKRQANQFNDDASTFHRDLIYLAHSSVAGISIIPMQDLLGFGNDCRMNTPGTRDNNWQWRCAGRFITDDLADWFGDVTAFFGRLNSIPATNTPALSTTEP